MKNIFQRPATTAVCKKTFGILVGLAVVSASAPATQQAGYSSQSTRSRITSNLYTTQWGQSPLFNFVMQTSDSAWGYDMIHATNTFAAAAADGTCPASSATAQARAPAARRIRLPIPGS